MELPRSLVKCPYTPYIIRAGRGFSLGEIKESGLKADLLKKLGVYIDKRRRSVHKENIEALKNIIKEQKPVSPTEKSGAAAKKTEVKVKKTGGGTTETKRGGRRTSNLKVKREKTASQ
ncbi:MAG: ribosomal protein L13e [Candidatus Odinarchaeota archaeon]